MTPDSFLLGVLLVFPFFDKAIIEVLVAAGLGPRRAQVLQPQETQTP